MDRTFIKQCDCEEIQNKWKPQIGDFIGWSDTGGVRTIWDGADGEYQSSTHHETGTSAQNKKAIWLPTQSQIQELLMKHWWGDMRPANAVSAMLQKFYWWLDEAQPKLESMEQLWLSFYLKEITAKKEDSMGEELTPDDWMVTISDKGMKEIATKMVSLSVRFPYLRSRVRELVWLICMEDKRQ